MTVERWDTCEFSFSSETDYGNPFTEVDLTALFTHENGRTIQVNGFYDGDHTWRVRFMPLEDGVWTFETVSNDPALNGQTGSLTGVPPTKDYLKGPISAKGHHFFSCRWYPTVFVEYAFVMSFCRAQGVVQCHSLFDRSLY